ncbi:EAL domain-containing protein [Cohnella zeiphila]|uniref:EAL domain-containing protein n=1 Tax=Cohnella zeiphila TaxID=2761120 RepID=A0A7X0SPI8_9BACL|nr:EAL domain-containing protein [Cohnella zeiphila]MBB6732659.1 EAL domain-containing protein [Cohnella zeiphila]
MMGTWLESGGWSRLTERAAELFGNGGDGGALGLICLELDGSPYRENGPPRIWNDWLAQNGAADAKLWLGAEVAGHLWVCAEVPAAEGLADDVLRDAGRKLRHVLLARGKPSGDGNDVSSGTNDGEGFGYAVLKRGPGCPASIKDAMYEAAVQAIWRLRQSVVARDGDDEPQRIEMERLLRERSIRSVYQPIVRLGAGEVFGYEALTRCPADSLFDGPLALFGFAEKNGYAYALDRLAREKAIDGVPTLNTAQKIFINVTMGIMKDPRFVSGQTAQWLRRRGLRQGQVVLELTERSSIDDFGEAKKILRHYREQGYEIAIDDAGAGYSSLQAIVELRPDYIKVDKSLVQNADGDEMKKQMLRTFVRFAKRMDIRTVAEGIERPQELRMLRTMGVDFGQGYLLGRPGEYGADAARNGLPMG